MHTHRHLRLRETLSERREIWYTDAVQRVLFNGAGFGGVVVQVHVQRTCTLGVLWFRETFS